MAIEDLTSDQLRSQLLDYQNRVDLIETELRLRLADAEKQTVKARFKDGEIDALVSEIGAIATPKG